MPRSIESYADAMARILQEIGRALVTPDADQEFLTTLQSMIVERMRNPNLEPVGVSVAGGQPGFSASQMQEGGAGGMAGQAAGVGAGVPTQDAQTRLPQSLGAGSRDMTEELRRAMAGS